MAVQESSLDCGGDADGDRSSQAIILKEDSNLLDLRRRASLGGEDRYLNLSNTEGTVFDQLLHESDMIRLGVVSRKGGKVQVTD